MGASMSMIPPGLPGPRCFMWRLIIFRPSTTTRPFFGSDCLTLPRLPLSLPAMIRTSSPVLTCITKPLIHFRFLISDFRLRSSDRKSKIGNPKLQYFGCQRDDLHEGPLAQLARDWAKDAGAARVIFLADDHRRVVVEAD